MEMKQEKRRGPWTEEEDIQLKWYVRLFGERRWDFLAQASGLNRTGKSCRLRWLNYLHPGLKHGRMTPQEEHLVLQLHSHWGNRWSCIARKLPGRTDNEIKNYWRTQMRKKAQERKRDSSSTSSDNNDISLDFNEPPLRTERGGKEEEDMEGYPMDQIWNMDSVSELSFEGCSDEICDGSWNQMPCTVEECYLDSLWKIEDEELLS
ncbi:hypothetical protein J5N97_002317 [Dioscorea zingiberensis]|uniref:Uncharacterized protein n=1 Tax=Dioscorea zingiberensis TaxID=325984 RepID=A0A9D5D1Z5_9LILI|nr:hypothetical protein J5N97_002317 [Dioscorea zingiberensis]